MKLPATSQPSIEPTGPRSGFPTRLGWVFVVIGAIGLPLSFVALLMVLGGSSGSSGGSFIGGTIVILGPLATLVAGISLIRRRRWGHAYAVVVLAAFAANSVFVMIRGPIPESKSVSPSGTVTTRLATNVDYPVEILIVVICGGLIWKLMSPAMRAQFGNTTPTA